MAHWTTPNTSICRAREALLCKANASHSRANCRSCATGGNPDTEITRVKKFRTEVKMVVARLETVRAR
jgi:hypothetical protein